MSKSKWRIGLHALHLASATSKTASGNFHHVLRLARELNQLDELELFVVTEPAYLEDFAAFVPVERLVVCQSARPTWFERELHVARFCDELALDIYHQPFGQLPLFASARALVMGVADLNFKDVPTGSIKRIYKELTYFWSILRAHEIVVISKFTKSRVSACYPWASRKLAVVYHGADGGMGLTEREMPHLKHKKFWLCFGHAPNKNLGVVIEAFLSLGKQGNDSTVLAVVGDNAYTRGLADEFLARGAAMDRIIFHAKVDSAELRWLYRHAVALVFPSRYEGFGLPAAEAMSMGCPAILSTIPALREVGGEAALYCEIDDFDGLAQQMDRLLRDEELRARLSYLGVEQARNFTWNEAARKTLALYERACPMETGRAI